MKKLVKQEIQKTLICGWCSKTFYATISKGKSGEREILSCPHCARRLPSSKKESTGDLSGRKHIHTEWKSGDIVI